LFKRTAIAHTTHNAANNVVPTHVTAKKPTSFTTAMVNLVWNSGLLVATVTYLEPKWPHENIFLGLKPSS